MLMHHIPPVFIRWTLRPVNFCDTPSANLVPLTVKTARVPEVLPPEVLAVIKEHRLYGSL